MCRPFGFNLATAVKAQVYLHLGPRFQTAIDIMHEALDDLILTVQSGGQQAKSSSQDAC